MKKKLYKGQEDEDKGGVEGYVDKERNVFVVTADPNGMLTKHEEPKTAAEAEIDYKKIGDLLKEYKPKWMK